MKLRPSLVWDQAVDLEARTDALIFCLPDHPTARRGTPPSLLSGAPCGPQEIPLPPWPLLWSQTACCPSWGSGKSSKGRSMAARRLRCEHHVRGAFETSSMLYVSLSPPWQRGG